MRYKHTIFVMALLAAGMLEFTGCTPQGAYFAAMEKFGYQKRDILLERVQEARDAQTDAKQQFKSALEEFSAVLAFQGGTLEEKYKKLNATYEESEKRANAVHDRVRAVERVSDALFAEWEKEIDEYANKTLARESEDKLKETRSRYKDLIAAMRRAEDRIDPVLIPFRDNVLFLKHNLNAQAVASLQGELGTIEKDVAKLLVEMEAAINEANTFIQAVSATPAGEGGAAEAGEAARE